MHGDYYSNIVPSDVQGICPAGWHVPSQMEFVLLAEYVSSRSKYRCNGNYDYIAKALCDTVGWMAPSDNSCSCCSGYDIASNNATGFSGYPAGYCYNGTVLALGYSTIFWCATENVCFGWTHGSPHTYWTHHDFPSSGFSVRCVRDEYPSNEP